MTGLRWHSAACQLNSPQDPTTPRSLRQLVKSSEHEPLPPRRTRLHHILPVQHQVGICLEARHVHGIRYQESEVGLEELVAVVGLGPGAAVARAGGPAAPAPAPAAAPAAAAGLQRAEDTRLWQQQSRKCRSNRLPDWNIPKPREVSPSPWLLVNLLAL